MQHKPCGTEAAYLRHRRNNEPPCDACRLAHNAYNREWYRSRHGGEPFTPARCGTRSGYRKHRRNGEDACPACKEAAAEAQRFYWRGESPSPIHDQPSTYEMIEDVLETYGYAMTTDVLVSHVLDIKRDWKPGRVRRAIERMVADGRLERFERLGDRVLRLTDELEEAS